MKASQPVLRLHRTPSRHVTELHLSASAFAPMEVSKISRIHDGVAAGSNCCAVSIGLSRVAVARMLFY